MSSTHITQAVASLQLREQELALEIERCRKTLESLLVEQRLIAKSLRHLLEGDGSATSADGRRRITDQEVGAIARELLSNGPPMQQEQLKAALLARIKAQGRVATGVPLFLARVLRNKAQFTLTADGYSLAEGAKADRESA